MCEIVDRWSVFPRRPASKWARDPSFLSRALAFSSDASEAISRRRSFALSDRFPCQLVSFGRELFARKLCHGHFLQTLIIKRGNAMIENLENRCLLSATMSAGVLTVTGTAGRDNIHLDATRTTLKVAVNHARTSFKLADVKSLIVNGLAGNDTIDLGRSVIGATVDGGDGNDRIIGTDKADSITGGPGNDWIFARGGNDVVNGGDGKDVLIGGAGNDSIHGDAGNDLIEGSTGDDSLFGDAGDDRLDGGPGKDKIDGGAGTDRAHKSKDDVLTAVEKA
jgi:Ca2+-binding RTX toxin-like protein